MLVSLISRKAFLAFPLALNGILGGLRGLCARLFLKLQTHCTFNVFLIVLSRDGVWKCQDLPCNPPNVALFSHYVACSGVRGWFRCGPANFVTHSSTALVLRDLFVEWETISHFYL